MLQDRFVSRYPASWCSLLTRLAFAELQPQALPHRWQERCCYPAGTVPYVPLLQGLVELWFGEGGIGAHDHILALSLLPLDLGEEHSVPVLGRQRGRRILPQYDGPHTGGMRLVTRCGGRAGLGGLALGSRRIAHAQGGVVSSSRAPVPEPARASAEGTHVFSLKYARSGIFRELQLAHNV